MVSATSTARSRKSTSLKARFPRNSSSRTSSRATVPEAKAGDTVSTHYVGVAWSTGEEFDASWGRGAPLDFRVGVGQVIQGWDQGLLGMKVGGRRRLEIPSELAYGSRGAGGAIGPNEALIFVVDLVGVR